MLTEHAKATPLMERKTNKLPLYRAPAPAARAATGGGLKLAITGAFFLSVVALAGAGVLYHSLTQEREERATLEAQRVQLQDQIESLQREEEHLQTQVSRLREQLKSYSVENAKIKKELDDRYLDISNFQDQIRSLENRNSALERQLTGEPLDTVTEGSELVAQPLEFSSETASDVPAASTTETEAAAPETPASETAAVEPQATQPEASAPAEVATEEESLVPLPQVMTVNRKFNFVVINLGLKDGLKMGDRLEVFRDGQPIAEIQVEKLYDRFAAATILQEVKKFKIEKEDKVRAYS
jgi:hypothetical protein